MKIKQLEWLVKKQNTNTEKILNGEVDGVDKAQDMKELMSIASISDGDMDEGVNTANGNGEMNNFSTPDGLMDDEAIKSDKITTGGGMNDKFETPNGLMEE